MKEFEPNPNYIVAEESMFRCLKAEEFEDGEFGPAFSELTEFVLQGIPEVPGDFDGCAPDSIEKDDKAFHILGRVFWLCDPVFDSYRFDVDKTGTGLYSWKFFRKSDKFKQVLFVAKMKDGWWYDAQEF